MMYRKDPEYGGLACLVFIPFCTILVKFSGSTHADRQTLGSERQATKRIRKIRKRKLTPFMFGVELPRELGSLQLCMVEVVEIG
jgi:hypothetical protein